MKHDWKPDQLFALAAMPQRTVQEVLLEYDGPLVVLLKDQIGLRYLGVAVDESAHLRRWIESPVSDLEVTAMKCGALSVRNALLKPEMMLVDIDHYGHVVSASRLKREDAPESALPEVGAMLPSDATVALGLDADGSPEFQMSGREAKDGRLPFITLSLVTSNLQVLWNAIAPEFNATRSTLSAVALAKSSFKVKVHVDDRDLFDNIAGTYNRLAAATYDEAALEAILAKSRPTVVSAYTNYLKAVDINQLEILGKWRTGAAFVGYEGARRARKTIRTVTKVVVPQSETIKRRGFLEGWGRKPQHFEFYDTDLGLRYIGRVSKALSAIPMDVQIVLGHQNIYDVEILVEPKLGKPAPNYTLLSFKPYSDK